MRRAALLLLVAAVPVAAAGCGGDDEPAAAAAPAEGRVVRVVDGDTAILRLDLLARRPDDG